MRLLTLCYPTFGKDNHLHLTSDGKGVVLAPDEFHAELMQAGWEVTVASLGPPTDKRLLRSDLRLASLNRVAGQSYGLLWHMFRDPTQPEVLAALQPLASSLPSAGAAVNNASALAHHNKLHYLPILAKYDLAPEIVDTG